MKILKKNTLVVVFMLGTLFNYANDKNDFNYTADIKKVKVVFENVKEGDILTIKDNQGAILHTENANKEGNLTKFFDFSSLKDGNYTIELNKDFEIIIRSFKVKSNIVVFQKGLEKIISKPVIRNRGNLILISKYAHNNENVKIILYFNDNAIYKETIINEATLNRAYRLDNSIKGDYKAVVFNNGKSYTHKFKI